ncbi:ORF72 [White spot syndrome virus]|uniref:Wsv509 n=3 Tax=White spot syndrome virus TaxID=342409 RepID=Q8VAB7_WSSVS|nr:wsv509 [Shrimp white spot syndrome virus]AFX59871.1 wsv509 [White spot syndrome virus]AAL33510.1 wsv509 [Shrimp white spot syndrome virus]ATU83933.1 ORF72 [White spot syndrome virus]AWQ60606.1 wsv499 [Shrimp white spot syndrome virus]AWQ61043.1 wsv499 [Shrimp white spot syndrome virus]
MKILMSDPVTSLTISINNLSFGGSMNDISLPFPDAMKWLLKWFRILSLMHIGASEPVMDMTNLGLRSSTSLFL